MVQLCNKFCRKGGQATFPDFIAAFLAPLVTKMCHETQSRLSMSHRCRIFRWLVQKIASQTACHACAAGAAPVPSGTQTGTGSAQTNVHTARTGACGTAERSSTESEEVKHLTMSSHSSGESFTNLCHSNKSSSVLGKGSLSLHDGTALNTMAKSNRICRTHGMAFPPNLCCKSAIRQGGP